MSTNGDGIDLSSIPDIRSRDVKDPDRDEAREVQDPHEWTDDTPSVRERITPETTGQWIGATAALLVVGGLVWYLFPIFAPAITNPFVIIGLVFLAYSAGLYLKGRQDGIMTYIGLDKSILYYGDDADVRLCRDSGIEGRSTVVTPLKHLGYAGLRATPLALADLPFDTAKLKSKHQTGSDPEEQPARDRLNQSTVSVQTDTIGTVHVTHASDLSYDSHGRHSDRFAEPPTTIDDDVAEEFRLQHEEMATLKDSQTIPQFEQLMDGFEDMMQILGRQRIPGGQQHSDQSGGTVTNGHDIDKDTLRHLENNK